MAWNFMRMMPLFLFLTCRWNSKCSIECSFNDELHDIISACKEQWIGFHHNFKQGTGPSFSTSIGCSGVKGQYPHTANKISVYQTVHDNLCLRSFGTPRSCSSSAEATIMCNLSTCSREVRSSIIFPSQWTFWPWTFRPLAMTPLDILATVRWTIWIWNKPN